MNWIECAESNWLANWLRAWVCGLALLQWLPLGINKWQAFFSLGIMRHLMKSRLPGVYSLQSLIISLKRSLWHLTWSWGERLLGEKMLLFAADGKTLKTSCFWSSELMFAVRLSEFVEYQFKCYLAHAACTYVLCVSLTLSLNVILPERTSEWHWNVLNFDDHRRSEKMPRVLIEHGASRPKAR